jgi:signal transduction histidine kinase
MIHKIIKNTQRMKKIIQETLTLVQISEEGSQVHPSSFDLQGEIQKILSENQTFLDQNNVKIETSINPTFSVVFDKNQFHHVLNNLITNAVKYTSDKNTCYIYISAVANQNKITVSVKDNGIGLNKEEQQQVFEKFFKTGTPRDGMDSTGLGLSICKRIIEKHGGKIWVESPGTGKGSTFSFTLPVNKTSEET